MLLLVQLLFICFLGKKTINFLFSGRPFDRCCSGDRIFLFRLGDGSVGEHRNRYKKHHDELLHGEQ